ncbi:hypothetical protein ID0562_11190 [Helicobacter pylori]
MAVRFGVIFITDNYTIDSVSQISQYQLKQYLLKQYLLKQYLLKQYLLKQYLLKQYLLKQYLLKQYLLGLKEKLGFELTGIFYCENANAHKIELIGNDSDFREVLLEFSENIPKAPNEIPQFLTNFKNSKIPNEKISFSPPKDYPSLYKVYGYFKREVRDTFDRYLWQSGKIIGKKIISNAFDLSVSYCFITLDGLKNLKERLFIDVINVINQKKRVALNHAQIDDIQYNVLDSAFYFIFDVGNPSHLAIKVPIENL